MSLELYVYGALVTFSAMLILGNDLPESIACGLGWPLTLPTMLIVRILK